MMPQTDNVGRVHRIVAEVFGIAAETITEESSPDTIPTWDSVSHINLVLSLETEFGIALSPEDVMEMQSVRLICVILAERGVVDVV